MDLSELDARAIIVLAVMVVGAIRWFLEKYKGSSGDQEAAESPFEDLYEEARREIVSRQNRTPQEQPSPPPVQQAQRTQATVPQQQQRPALHSSRSTDAPPPLPNWQKPIQKAKLSAAEKEALARVQQQPMSGKKKQIHIGGTRVRQMLSSPSAARDAIVLSEILGSPKGATGR